MIPAGCKVSEISNFLRKKILYNGEVVKSITIIDPYFFSQNSKKPTLTEEIILNIFQNYNELKSTQFPYENDFEELENIKVIVPRKKYKKKEESYKSNLEKELHKKNLKKFKKITVIPIEDKFHDRFWIINDKKAFIVGASINGMGNKHFYIQDDFLTKKDTVTLLCLYTHGHITNTNKLYDICKDK